jgi:surface antigen
VNDKMSIKNSLFFFSAMLALTGCQTVGSSKPVTVSVMPSVTTNTGAGISGGGLIGGAFGGALSVKDRQLALNAEYKALEYGKVGEVNDWSGEGGTVSGKVKAAQPYRVGSQDCRQYSHEISTGGMTRTNRGTACRNSDGSWSLLE